MKNYLKIGNIITDSIHFVLHNKIYSYRLNFDEIVNILMKRVREIMFTVVYTRGRQI